MHVRKGAVPSLLLLLAKHMYTYNNTCKFLSHFNLFMHKVILFSIIACIVVFSIIVFNYCVFNYYVIVLVL